MADNIITKLHCDWYRAYYINTQLQLILLVKHIDLLKRRKKKLLEIYYIATDVEIDVAKGRF